MTVENRPRLGFIGLGQMGSRMARRLLEAGYPLTVYNRAEEKTRPLAQRGAVVAKTPRELAEQSDFILSSVADDHAAENVLLGEEGAMAGARAGTVFIEMSTLYPRMSQQLHETAITQGLRMLDTPVSGSGTQAEQGTLVIFVGGEASLYQECLPIFQVLGKESFYMGPAGSGVMMKLVVNTLLGIGVQALAEALALGLRAGMEKNSLINVLAQTGVVSPLQKSKLENARQDHYSTQFPLRLMNKDFCLILRKAGEMSVPMPMTAAAHQMCLAEHARGIEEDFSAVIRLMSELAAARE